MATEAKQAKKTRGGTVPLSRWATRVFIALVIGASLGAGAGVVTVNRLEPGRGTGIDSLAVMLDSIARGKVPAADADKRGEQSPNAAKPADEAAAPPELIAVPALADFEESAARDALLDAGLQVGEVQFEASPKPAGTVLSTIPIAGSNVAPNTPVTLVLSDGRTAPPDTLSPSRPTTYPSSNTP